MRESVDLEKGGENWKILKSHGKRQQKRNWSFEMKWRKKRAINGKENWRKTFCFTWEDGFDSNKYEDPFDFIRVEPRDQPIVEQIMHQLPVQLGSPSLDSWIALLWNLSFLFKLFLKYNWFFVNRSKRILKFHKMFLPKF